MSDSPSTPRVNLYFSSESHIHGLRNTMLLSGMPDNETAATTLEVTQRSAAQRTHANTRRTRKHARP